MKNDIVKVLRGKYALDYDEKTLDQFCNEAADEIEKLRAMLKEYDDAFEDWFPFVEGRKDDPNEETKACTRLVKAQRVARAALGERG